VCVIVSKAPKRKLNKKIWAECFRCNKDGAGFAYIENRQIVVKKGFFKFEEFWEEMSKYENHGLLVHFRITTHGGTNQKNCHPFAFQSKANPHFQWVMAHNGQLPWRSQADKSDTACFAEEFLFPTLERDPFLLDQKFGIWALERVIGDRNKMVILRYDSKKNVYDTYIINEEAGNWAHGVWFSNTSWKPATTGYFPVHDINDPVFNAMHGEDEWNNEPGQDGLHDWVLNKNAIWVNKKLGQCRWDGVVYDIAKGQDLDNLGAKPEKKAEIIKVEAPAGQLQIEVPRDAGVLTEAEDDKLDQNCVGLNHLNKVQRRDMRRLAYGFMKTQNMNLGTLNQSEILKIFRDKAREAFPAMKQLTDMAMDKFVLTYDHAELIGAMNSMAGEERQARLEIQRGLDRMERAGKLES
jgi:hypothetical protein